MEAETRAERVSRLAPAIAGLGVDRVTAEVVSALRDAGIRSIVLKGPAVARWLYGDGASRPYLDTDLLVDPESLGAAESVLRDYGFRRGRPGWQEVSFAWGRDSDGSLVDLHTSLFGAEGAAERVWQALSTRTEPLRVGGSEVEVLTKAALALHVALHAVQHNAEPGTPLEDLSRALKQAGEQDWREAAAIAAELGATTAFAAGLSLDPRGEEIVSRLDLEPGHSAAVSLHARAAPPLTLGIEHLASAPGWGGRMRFAVRKLVPPPRQMRRQWSLARRGPLGLSLTYLWQPIWLLVNSPRALVAWRRARRSAE